MRKSPLDEIIKISKLAKGYWVEKAAELERPAVRLVSVVMNHFNINKQKAGGISRRLCLCGAIRARWRALRASGAHAVRARWRALRIFRLRYVRP